MNVDTFNYGIVAKLLFSSLIFISCTAKKYGANNPLDISFSCELPTLNPIHSVTSFGAIGDGITDDTIALKNALSVLKSEGGTLLFETNKVYKISSTLLIQNGSDFVINGNGASIVMADGIPTDDYRLLAIEESNNYSIANLIIDGNRSGRVPAEAWGGHNIHINGGHNWNFCKVTSKNACTDGFYITAVSASDSTTYPYQGIFKNCIGDNNFRQGMSIINGYNIKILGGEYSNTNGTAPEAGIDLEPNATSANPGVWDILVQGVQFSNNQGSGLTAGGPIRIEKVTVEQSNFINNGLNGSSGRTDLSGLHAGFSNSLIRNNTFNNHGSNVFRSVLDFPFGLDVTGNVVQNNLFIENSATDYMIYVHSGSGINNYIIDNTFKHNVGLPINNQNERSDLNPTGTCSSGNLNNDQAVNTDTGSCGIIPNAGYSL